MNRSAFHADHALVDGEVKSEVGVTVVDGIIASVEVDAVRRADAVHLDGLVTPGLVNTHSHVFHRALRGRSWAGGDFWSWRDSMYELVGELDPDSLERLATATFAEMVAAGITVVGEFHYLHHGRGGAPYEDRNEMSLALVRAAEVSGIRLCLLDTCYLVAGVDGRPLVGPQLRFGDGSVEAWSERHADLAARVAGHPLVTVGAAIHSVRAVPPEAFGHVAGAGGPLHMHVSEQPAENDACLEHHGVTPARLLNQHGVLSPRTTVVHAVHVTGDDVADLADSGTRVCVCPTTELDLGDGTVDVARLRRAGIGVALGSDSHAVIDLLAEARHVEWNDRARTGGRGVHEGSELWRMATTAGAEALGYDQWGLSPGAPADFVVVATDTIGTAGSTVDGLIGCATAPDVTATYVGGELVCERQVHRSLGDVGQLLTRALGSGA